MRGSDFDRLYEEYAEPLLGYLTYRTGNRATAEDLLADTFERILKAKRGYDPRRGTEKAWIYAIALNLARDHARRRLAEERALGREADGQIGTVEPGPSEVIERRHLVREALHVLSEEERETVALRFGGDLTNPEVAALLDQPLTTVEGRLYRALRKLRDAVTTEAEPARPDA